MKQLAVVAGCALVGFLAWFMASRLSSDALGMAVGLLFGVLAGIPTALLVLASGRHQSRRPYDAADADCREEAEQYLRPVTINYNVTHNTDNRQLTVNTGAQGMPLLADRKREIDAKRSGRVFKVVGERQEWYS